MLEVAKCPQCGAGLPAPAAASAYVACHFCGATVHLAGSPPAAAHAPQESPRVAGDAIAAIPTREQFNRFPEAFGQARASRMPLAAAVQCAARAVFGQPGGAEGLGAAVAHLADEFRASSGADISGEAMAVQRVFEGYVKARVELRQAAETTINLPFLAVTAQGPVHFERKLTPAQIALLEAAEAR